MSKKLSYRGTLAIGQEDRIRLRTLKGKVGYKIVKFQIMSTTPGATGTGTYEYIGKITKIKDSNIGTVVNFTDGNLLAVIYYQDSASAGDNNDDGTVIFDNEIINQDIFVNITDASGNTTPCNYYIELEAMALTDLEATQITLKSLRTIEETI